MAHLLGIDAGTTALKVALFDEEGHAIAQSDEETPLLAPAPGFVELDVETYWQGCARAVRQIVELAGAAREDIAALAISCHADTFVPIGEDGRPLRNAIVEADDRSIEEAQFIRDRFGDDPIYKVTGQPYVFSSWAGTKMLWLKRHEAGLNRRTHKYLLLEDYLLFRFTGQFVCEHSLICSSLLFDIRTRRWWDEMLEFLGIGQEQLPAPFASGHVVGRITAAAAAETGLPSKTLAVTGALDQAAAMVGSGNIRPGIVSESTGTVLAICATMPVCATDADRRIPVHCHALPGRWFTLPWCRTAGAVLKWLRDNFCQEETAQAKAQGTSAYDVMSAMAADIPPGSDGLVMLPHLIGAVYPEFCAGARGVFFGIAPRHTKAHFIRAVMEAVAFMLRRNLEVLEQAGVSACDIRSLGGASQSDLWTRIKADVTRVPIIRMEDGSLAAARGAAILAGLGAGIYATAESACEAAVRTSDRTVPDASSWPAYDAAYRTYVKLFAALEPLFARGEGATTDTVQ